LAHRSLLKLSSVFGLCFSNKRVANVPCIVGQRKARLCAIAREVFSTFLLGLTLGLRHVLEPDHLAAVSALADTKKPRAAAVIGLWWGLGHANALMLVAGGLAFAETLMPPRLETALELGVGLMVMALGARALWQSVVDGQAGQATSHHHGTHAHVHPVSQPHVHVGGTAVALRPLLVGIMHGLAGSGAVAAAVVSRAPSFAERLTSIGAFGLGSVLGMGALTAIVALWLGQLQKRQRVIAWVTRAAACLSVGIGGWWGFTAATQLLA
jgi:hypothetical protein